MFCYFLKSGSAWRLRPNGPKKIQATATHSTPSKHHHPFIFYLEQPDELSLQMDWKDDSFKALFLLTSLTFPNCPAMFRLLHSLMELRLCFSIYDEIYFFGVLRNHELFYLLLH